MKILIIGGKHRHKYAIANRMVKYAEQKLGVPHPFILISEPDETQEIKFIVPPKDVQNGIFVLKTGFTTFDVLENNTAWDSIIRLPTDSKGLEYWHGLELSVSSKATPISDFADMCIDRVIEQQNTQNSLVSETVRILKERQPQNSPPDGGFPTE